MDNSNSNNRIKDGSLSGKKSRFESSTDYANTVRLAA